MYELKLLKTVQSEGSSARLVLLVTIHNFPMDLLCDVKQATFMFSYFFCIKKQKEREITSTPFEKNFEIPGYWFQN